MNEILILGAGYTGMAATVGLAGRLKGRDDAHITPVNPQTRFTERLRLLIGRPVGHHVQEPISAGKLLVFVSQYRLLPRSCGDCLGSRPGWVLQRRQWGGACEG
jgi:hypothetical protein